MTGHDIDGVSVSALIKAPIAPKQPQRSELDMRIDDTWHRMVSADDLSVRLIWAQRLTQLKKARAAA